MKPDLGDPFVEMGRRLFGSPGQHMGRVSSWLSATVVGLVVAIITWLLTIAKALPCVQTEPDHLPSAFGLQCYSDIPLLFQNRGLIDGNTPYLDHGAYQVLEYPVGTGWFMELARLIGAGLGMPVGPGLDSLQVIEATNTFYAVNMVLLGGLFFLTVWAHSRSVPGRSWDVLIVAASPVVVLTGVVNWDMLPVALTALGVLFWARERPGLAGVMWGLGMAAKLYPLFLLGPLLLLCLRARKMREFFTTVAAFALAWALANFPAWLLAPQQWQEFWTFNSDRGGDFGSLWYVFALAGVPLDDVNFTSIGLFVLGCVAIAALLLLAPRRPRLGQAMFLVLVAFTLTNKVYSPQYVLWLLPFVALARPKWRDVIIFTIGEWLYNMAIWGHLGGYIGPADGGPDKIFWAATVLRLGTQGYLAVMVVRDILYPRHDVVRHVVLDRRDLRTSEPGEIDDPSGGVLNHAPDAPWWTSVRLYLTALLAGERRLLPDPATAGGRRASWFVLGGTWFSSRLLILIIGIAAAIGLQQSFLDVTNNWDAEHFLGIAANGYETTGDNAKRMAFFPGLPLLLKPFMAIGIPGEIAGILISLAASLVAALALRRLGGIWAAVLWLVAPTMIFQVMPYTESLFCAFAFWAWYFARRDTWWPVALLTMGAMATRVSGLFLIAALGILILTHREPDGPSLAVRLGRIAKRAVWLLPAAGVFFGYMFYLYAITGNWRAWLDAQQSGWVRGWHWPWESFLNTIPVIQPGAYADHPGWEWIFRFEVVSMVVGLLAVGYLIAKKMWGEATWIGLQLISFSTSYWLFSVNRAVLLWFPVWIIAARLITRTYRNRATTITVRILAILWLIGSIGVGMWWAGMFYNHQWTS